MVRMILLISLFILGCSEKFSLPKQENLSGKLRLDGCYYSFFPINNHQYVSIYFFYENGIIYHENIPFESVEKGLQVYIDRNKDINYAKVSKKDQTIWGLYNILNDNITIEKAEPVDGLPMLKEYGKIINDTTFVLNQSKEHKVLTKYSPEYLHFKQFRSKPDSTYCLIKWKVD